MITIKKTVQTNNTSGQTNSKEYIVLHHTATGYGSIDGVLNYFVTGNVSCHYIVDINGDIYKMNTDNDILWHAGVSSRDSKSSMNQYSIGIETIGPLPGFTDYQRKSLRLLVLDLMSKYRIPHYRIIRHKDIAPDRKIDIDDSFWNNSYANFVAYQQSFQDIQQVAGIYEKLFKKEFTDNIIEGETIIKNVEGSLSSFVGVNGTFNLKEFIYLMMIAVERLKNEVHTNSTALADQNKYENTFNNEFESIISTKSTIIQSIDGVIQNCINQDGTFNLKEFIYLMMIAVERLKKVKI